MYVSRPRPTFLYLRESISKYKGTKDLLLLRLLSQISNGSQDFFYGMFLVPALQNGAFGFYKSVYRLPYPFRVLILPSDFNYTRRFLAENNGNLCIRVWTLLIYQKYNIFRHIDKFCMYAYCLCRSNVYICLATLPPPSSFSS